MKRLRLGAKKTRPPPGALTRSKREPANADTRSSTTHIHFSDPQTLRRYWRTNGKYRVSPSRFSESSPPRPRTAAVVNLGVVSLGGATAAPATSTVKQNRPRTAGAVRRRPAANTLFKRYYQRGDLPISIDHCGGRGNRIKWRVKELGALDYHVFLPIFFDGLRETEDPYRFLAVQGTIELLQAGPSKLIAVIPQIIIPMKSALSTCDPLVVCSVLKTIQFMLSVNPRVGLALAPYYRQILPQLRIFKNVGNRGVDDSIEYDQQQRLNVGDLIVETLEVLQRTGGPEAYHQIKYIIPTYERTEF